MTDNMFVSDLIFKKLKEKYKEESKKLFDEVSSDLSLFGMSVYKLEHLPDDAAFIVNHVEHKGIFKPFVLPPEPETEEMAYTFRPRIGVYEEYITNGMKLEYGSVVVFSYKEINALAITEIILRRLYAHFILGVKSSFKPNRFKKPDMDGILISGITT